MKISSKNPVKLVCKYWGGIDKERSFDIYVDNQKIATQTLHLNKPGRFIYITYPLDKKFTEGKDKITVKFSAPQKGIAGGVFGVWTTE